MNGEASQSQSFAVRPATDADAHALRECLHEAFEPYRDRYTPGAFADTVISIEEVRKRLADMVLFVAQGRQDAVIGTIGCSVVVPGEGHIRGLAVRPDAQGGGVASRLLEAAEAAMRQRGCTTITLDTTIPLERAMQLYERRGYRQSGVVRDFFGMPLLEYVKRLE